MNPPQSPSLRERLRLASRIVRQIEQARMDAPGPLPEYDWQRLLAIRCGLEVSRVRGWTAGLPRLRRQHASLVRTVVHHLDARQRDLDAMRDRRPVTSICEILDDLAILETEFNGLAIDLRDRTFSVVTPSIVLEGIELGRFQIVVQVDRLGEPSPYEVVALDPNTATESSDVFHPHVQGESLCEGEGRAAIRKASADGRVLDLCVIVHQILQTYHSGSAYVPLSRWTGRTCQDCGTHASDKSSTTCRACEDNLCQDCADSCAVCSKELCSHCRSRCTDCQTTICNSCQEACEGCGEGHCRDCLSDERCSCCFEESETQSEEIDDGEETLEGTIERTPQPPTAIESAVHAVGVGQVPVPV
jgi:hypothetical protein